MRSFGRSLSDFYLLLLIVFLAPPGRHRACWFSVRNSGVHGYGSAGATSTSTNGGRRSPRPASPKSLSTAGEAVLPDIGKAKPRSLVSTSENVGGEWTDLRGGFGARQPEAEYNKNQPLFEFKVLVTGYEPFLDHDTNPAHEVALSLNDTCDTVYLRQPHTFRLCFEGVSVPVNFEGSSWAAKEIRQDPDRWDGVVHLGFESDAKGLKLETIASNVESSEEYGFMWNADVPCNKKGTPFRYIYEDAPCVLPTTAPLSYLNLDDLTALLKASGNGDLVSLQTWSRDAGSYYCNDQFFRTLHAIRSGTPAGSSLLPAMFVHLPDPTVLGLEHMTTMVKYIAESLILGIVGLLPPESRF